jgi:hypothetical protein
MTPRTSKSILKRPAPLPLSPRAPVPFAASFSVLVSPNKLSPHVHFSGSPAMVATFSALSSATYDRAPISVSPASAQHSSWADRVISPTVNGFKLGHPPKRTPTVAKNDTLTVPSFEDPRSPKPYISRNAAPKETSRDTPTVATLTVPSFGDPRSPKPYVARSAQKGTLASTGTTLRQDTLAAPPTFVDPRSPKPYIPRSGVRFEQLVLHVPRGPHAMEDLGKALTVYPRSPYPSAPIAAEEVDSPMSEFINSPRGRSPMRPSMPAKAFTHSRARSLDINSTSKRRHTTAAALSKNPAGFLSPVKESPGVMKTPATRPAPLPIAADTAEAQLSSAFWQAMTLEETPVSSGLKSPALMFGNQDGTLWSPRPRKKEFRGMGEMASMMSPAQRNVFRKGDVASPSPNDPFAAFPSFTVALMNMDGVISYPPRARVE